LYSALISNEVAKRCGQTELLLSANKMVFLYVASFTTSSGYHHHHHHHYYQYHQQEFVLH